MNRPLYRIALLTLLALTPTTFAQSIPPDLTQSLRWRCIGPFRAGRTVGAVGIPSKPNIFFIGVNNGGVWKTTDYGRTWNPLFDDQPTGSIGDLAVSESNPDILYVGSGEGLQRPDLSVGDGIYKSTDGGKTWKNTGLKNAQQIASIIIDPKDPDRVFVAALGHPYGPNEDRGIFRTLDGGATWQKVLYKNENVGAAQLAFDPQNPQTLYADLWEARQGPWENAAWEGEGSGLYKSTDGGTTWKQLTNGLPANQPGTTTLHRIGFGICNAHPNVLYATVDAGQQSGIYRSDDSGDSWHLINTTDSRIYSRGSDFAEIRPHPTNPDIVYIANTCAYKSTDGGKTFTAFRGAPGGDDYHRIWINPLNPDILLFATDQGAIITVNGGDTFSSWYNQPTAQFYHVITDNQFPYWVYGGQQESGSAAVASRGDYGAITWRDRRTVGAEEYGYIAPDPLDSNIIYGGKLTRFDKRTGQTQEIRPAPAPAGQPPYRFLRTAPIIFSPVDKKTLYYAGNVLFKTTTGGHAWDVISPDLSRETPETPDSVGIYKTPNMNTRRGVIYTIAPSFQTLDTLWVGTDDGLIHLTRDAGKTWKNVTPPAITAWSKISLLEASHFDNDSAYAAVNRLRVDDLKPHIFRTHDSGATWKEITEGIPTDGDVVNAVREDPQKKGLLYAATERAIYYSVDDGDHWQSLRNNMPVTSMRDLVIHDNDLVVGTHGRSFWILDDITPLRQLDEAMATADKINAILFQPEPAMRIRRSVNTDTPIPQEEAMGQNPPDGAIINYYLKSAVQEVTLEILDAQNNLVRKYSSADPPEQINENALAYPSYWFRPARTLPNTAGMHRWTWDLHYAPLPGPRSYSMQAIYHDTPTSPQGPSALPGKYTLRLTTSSTTMAAGAKLTGEVTGFTVPLTLTIDPRVPATKEDIAQMFEVSHGSYATILQLQSAQSEIRTLRTQLQSLRDRTADNAPLTTALTNLDTQLLTLDPATGAGRGGRGARGAGGGAAGGRRGQPAAPGANPTIPQLTAELTTLMTTTESADTLPTQYILDTYKKTSAAATTLLSRWTDLKTKDLLPLNTQLQQGNLPSLTTTPTTRPQ